MSSGDGYGGYGEETWKDEVDSFTMVGDEAYA